MEEENIFSSDSPSSSGEDGSPMPSGRNDSTASCGKDGSPLPRGMNGSPIASGMDGSPIPNGIDGSPIPSGVDASSVPSGMDGSPIPSGVDASSVPSGMDGSPIPSGMDASSVPSGMNGSPVPSGEDGSSVPTTISGSSVSSGIDGSPIPSRKDGSSVSRRMDGSPVPSGEDESPVPNGMDGSPVPSGEDGSPVPSGEDESPVPNGMDGSPVPSGEDESPVPSGEDESPVPNGMDGSPVPSGEDVACQLAQLQDLVREMKSGFAGAVEALARVQYGDRLLEQRVDQNREQYELQLADVVSMVLALKSEFGSMLGELKLATETQRTLQTRVDLLQCENDILLEELERAGTISPRIRKKYHSGELRPTPLNRSTDATSLCVLLERARATFAVADDCLAAGRADSSSQLAASEHDSGVTASHADGSSSEETSLVQSYITGIQSSQAECLEENYDSDSSLAAAVNKSLDLGRSLEDKCAALNDLQVESSEDEERGGDVAVEVPQHAGPIKDATKLEGVPYAHSSPMGKLYGSPRTIAPHERNAKESQRGRVAREILDTERSYCSSLWLLLDHFAASLQRSTILPAKDIAVMFPPSLERLYQQHCAFLQQLEERLLSCRWQCVLGDVFARLSLQGDLLKNYTEFVNEFPAALRHIRKCCHNNRRFKKFIVACQRDERCHGLDISSFLLTPIQRVPRYVLLLKQLLRYTDNGHPDCYYIESCLQTLTTFLNTLNDSIENSVTLVTSEVSPKSKRRTWISSSFHSNSSSHCGDTAAKDSGPQSSVDEPAGPLNMRPSRDPSDAHRSLSLQRGRDPAGALLVPGDRGSLVSEDGSDCQRPPSESGRKRSRRPKTMEIRVYPAFGDGTDGPTRPLSGAVDPAPACDRPAIQRLADYGVYGDSDDDVPDMPRVVTWSGGPADSSLPRTPARSALAARCVSHRDITSPDATTAVSQSRINDCVARSLMDVRLAGRSATGIDGWADASLADVSVMTVHGGDVGRVNGGNKKRRRHAQRSHPSSMHSGKKLSLRDSLKNIFSKKRVGRVIETRPAPVTTRAVHATGPSPIKPPPPATPGGPIGPPVISSPLLIFHDENSV